MGPNSSRVKGCPPNLKSESLSLTFMRLKSIRTRSKTNSQLGYTDTYLKTIQKKSFQSHSRSPATQPHLRLRYSQHEQRPQRGQRHRSSNSMVFNSMDFRAAWAWRRFVPPRCNVVGSYGLEGFCCCKLIWLPINSFLLCFPTGTKSWNSLGLVLV